MRGEHFTQKKCRVELQREKTSFVFTGLSFDDDDSYCLQL